MNTSNDNGGSSLGRGHNNSGILTNRFNPSSTKLTSDLKLRERSLSPTGPKSRTRAKSRIQNKNYNDSDDEDDIGISGLEQR